MRTKIKESLKWILISRQFQFVTSIAFQLLIMRILSPRIYGVYALAISALGLVAMFVSFGFAHSIIQFQKVEAIEKNVLGVTVLQTIAYIALTIPGLFIVKNVYGSEVGRVYLVLVFAYALAFLSLVFQFAIERNLDFKKTEIIFSVSKLIGTLATLLLALAGWGVYSLVAGFYVKVLIEAASFFKYSRWNYGIGWESGVVRIVVVYGWKRFLARGCGTMMAHLDKLLLGLMVPVAFVGGYERGLFIISSGLGLVNEIYARFAFSLINRIKDDSRQLLSLINRGTFINLTLAAGFALLAVFYLRDLILLVLGEQWQETARAIPYFGLYLIGIVPAIFIRQVFYAVKEPLHIVWGRLCEIAVFLLISLMIYRWVSPEDYSTPVYLMALNLGFSILVGVGYLFVILLRLKQLHPASLGKPLFLAALSGMIGWLLLAGFGLPAPVNVIAVGAIYASLLWKFCRTEFLWIKQFWQA